MLRTGFFVLCLGLLCEGVLSTETLKALSRHKRAAVDDGEQTCADDYMATSVCVACADLPQGMELPLDACCSSEFVQMMCAACLMDMDGCAKDSINAKLDEFEELKSEMTDSDEESDEGISKRFGRLFLSSGSPYGSRYRNRDSKRYGKLFMSSQPYYNYLKSYPEKRFGTLFLGNMGSSRYNQDRDKRYGKLFLKKRYGKLFLGNGFRYNRRWRKDKRSEIDDLPVDLRSEGQSKRFGRLFLSGPRRTGSEDKKSV